MASLEPAKYGEHVHVERDLPFARKSGIQARHQRQRRRLRAATAAVPSNGKHAWKCSLHVGARRDSAAIILKAGLKRGWASGGGSRWNCHQSCVVDLRAGGCVFRV
ncbi:hypothetical protein V5799_007515 [Amblyomma americanum]|uniref:Uncharacterized protein n=1 Tax=Amblyomma americanum TaxID=6943 RepID=A0AAQ4FHK2_AMBAM